MRSLTNRDRKIDSTQNTKVKDGCSEASFVHEPNKPLGTRHEIIPGVPLPDVCN